LADAAQPPDGLRRRGQSARRVPRGILAGGDPAAAETGGHHLVSRDPGGGDYRGVGAGTLVSNTTVVAKLLALGLVCVAGVLYLSVHPRVAATPLAASVDSWLQAMLLLLFAYGGYEAALNPMGEARDPRRDAAFALFVALLILIALYTLLQLIVVGVLADAAHSARPLADAARVLMGPAGAALISVGALISVYGYISANMLTGPRGIFALAERGEFPAWFATVHQRFRTPHCAIVVFALLLWAFSQFASFSWNLTLSAVARLLFYAAVCLAVPVLRRMQPAATALRSRAACSFPSWAQRSAPCSSRGWISASRSSSSPRSAPRVRTGSWSGVGGGRLQFSRQRRNLRSACETVHRQPARQPGAAFELPSRN